MSTTCPACEGKGYIEEEMTCPDCTGMGCGKCKDGVLVTRKKCAKCKGQGKHLS
ncbi:hypothetical protein HYY27_10295 [bacterium]|nr:hypothetical protein [bacterium]